MNNNIPQVRKQPHYLRRSIVGYLLIGWAASIMSAGMYISQIDQIFLNMSGKKGSVLLPFFTILSCICWVFYSLLKPEKDWPIFCCCSFGIILGILTLITAW